jgi:hypothetical protein
MKECAVVWFSFLDGRIRIEEKQLQEEKTGL